MSVLDAAIQSATPTVMVPHDGDLPPPPAGCKRFLMASDGVYIDVASRVLHARLRVAAIPLPYGPVEPCLSLVGDPIPAHLMRSAIASAITHPEREVAFGIEAVEQGGYTLREPLVRSASASHIAYEDSFIDSVLVIDIHSHGRSPAFFSPTDDQSDLARPGPYIAAVVGRVSQTPEMAFRLVCPPFLLPISMEQVTPLLAESGATSDEAGG